MSSIEIAKIKVRRGRANAEGVPQLDGGEFGWAVDTQELFIGNGELGDGAPTIGNTRLLTQYDRPQFLNVTTGTYIFYNGRLPTVFTDPSGESDTVNTVQAKLDSFVTLIDFGITASSTNASQGIQNAINQLFLKTETKALEQSRVTLHIPAGKYNITATIFIPPNVTITGDGKNKTVLNLVSTASSIFQTCDLTSVPGAPVLFVPGSSNITSQGSPRNINIRGVSFKYDPSIVDYNNTLPLVRLDCISNSALTDCSFFGNISTSSVTYSGIEIRGQNSITTNNLTLDQTDFNYLSRGIFSDYDLSDVVIRSASFTLLNRGIVFAENLAAGNSSGPTDVKVSDSTFTDIYREAWYIEQNPTNINTNNISTRNSFRNVGNDLGGELSAVSPILNFLSPGNMSVDDHFYRVDTINSTSTSATFYQTVNGKSFISQNNTYINTLTSAPTIAISFAKLPYSGDDQLIEMKYLLRKPVATISRKGTAMITISADTTTDISDNFRYSGINDGGLLFSASLNTTTNTISLLYTSPDADGTLEYKFDQLQ